MERRAQEIKLYNLLSNFAYDVNEGWVPNWDDKKDKYHIIYNNKLMIWEIRVAVYSRYPHIVYFRTSELARRAINEIVIPFERGEL